MESEDEVFYQITGKGLRALNVIDDTALRHFQRVEEERENWREIANAANQAADMMYNALIAIKEVTTQAEVAAIVDEVLDTITKEDPDG